MWDGPELAERYDRVSDVQFQSGRTLVGQMDIKAGDDVLDVGCGTGRLALCVSKIAGPSGSVTGIDPSPYRIRIAKDKLKGEAFPNLRFTTGRGEDLGFLPANAFDHVYYSSVFHWIDDKAMALREAFRVLRPGGRIGMTTVDRSHADVMRKMWEKALEGSPGAHLDMHSKVAKMLVSFDELDRLLRDAGFTGIDISIRPEKHYYPSPEKFIEFIEASSFGNFLREAPEQARPKIIRAMEGELEKRRTSKGIELDSRTTFAIARKPR